MWAHTLTCAFTSMAIADKHNCYQRQTSINWCQRHQTTSHVILWRPSSHKTQPRGTESQPASEECGSAAEKRYRNPKRCKKLEPSDTGKSVSCKEIADASTPHICVGVCECLQVCVCVRAESTDDKINDRQFKLIGRCLTEFKMQARWNQTSGAAQ